MQFVTHLWSKLLLFIRYLSIARDKEMKPGVKEGVDTLLLKLYAQLENTEQLKLLTASPNSCALAHVAQTRCMLGCAGWWAANKACSRVDACCEVAGHTQSCWRMTSLDDKRLLAWADAGGG
jgi:hypothetical protein